MKKIILIIPYFGKIPYYFNLWKMSALANDTVDFLFVTDIEEIKEEKNIKVQRCSFEDFKERVQSKFSFTIKLNRAYKCCDYRPAYGYIFAEEIAEYDFWGHCDIDLLFGNIRRFLTNDILEKYDKILEHGHFCLYRNTPDICKLFLQDGEYPEINYKECFQTDDSYAFDEFPGMLIKSRRLKVKLYDNTNLFWDNKTDEKAFYHAFAPDKTVRTIVEYSDGVLQLCQIEEEDYLKKKYENVSTREIMYFHFQKRDIQGIEENLLEQKHFYIIPNKLVDIETEAEEIFGVTRERMYQIKYKYHAAIKKLKDHKARFLLQKKNGEVTGLKQYFYARKALQKRFMKCREVNAYYKRSL